MSFTFKQFHIDDTLCAMKVGTDGVLLGAWANAEHAKRVLDIGCGSGLIAMMMAQRAPLAKVTGIEIDANAATNARHNVEVSPFCSRVEIVETNALHYHSGQLFDHIVTNPPYHEETLLPPTATRAQARHTAGGGLTFEALFEIVSRLLDKQAVHATFSVILPTQAVARFEAQAAIYGLNLWRKTNVVTRPGKPCKRTLLEFRPHNVTLIENTLILLNADGKRSNEYNSLCADFYL